MNSVRDATTQDLRNAQVLLGDIPPGVVDKLFTELRFRRTAASATLEGETWTLHSDANVFDRYEARYDGTGLHQTESRATQFPPKPLVQNETSTPTPQQGTGAIPPSARPGAIKADRLLACVRRAHEDVTRLAACQGR